MKIKIKIPDILIILFASGITIYFIFIAYFKPLDTLQVLIIGQGSEWFFPVNAEETVAVNGPIGETVVRIKNDRASFESSPCDNQTCVAAGDVSRHGQWAACLPNNVLLLVRGKKGEDADTIAW